MDWYREVVIALLLVLRMTFVRSTASRMSPQDFLHSDSDDEDVIVGSGQGWPSGSGFLDVDLFSEAADDEDVALTSRSSSSFKQSTLRLSTPEMDGTRASPPLRMSCIVCSPGDPSCRDPYRRNESHVTACANTGGGCLKVHTSTGDIYRNCLYGMFGTAENAPGCRSLDEQHIGHRFQANVSATICVCRYSECNGADLNQPTARPTDFTHPRTTGLQSTAQHRHDHLDDDLNTVAIHAHRSGAGIVRPSNVGLVLVFFAALMLCQTLSV